MIWERDHQEVRILDALGDMDGVSVHLANHGWNATFVKVDLPHTSLLLQPFRHNIRLTCVGWQCCPSLVLLWKDLREVVLNYREHRGIPWPG